MATLDAAPRYAGHAKHPSQPAYLPVAARIQPAQLARRQPSSDDEPDRMHAHSVRHVPHRPRDRPTGAAPVSEQGHKMPRGRHIT